MNILADILSATVLFAIPLLLVALGGMFSERSGVINIALEGIMVIGALISILLLRAFDMSGFGAAQPQLAVLIAILVAGLSGAVYSLLLAFAMLYPEVQVLLFFVIHIRVKYFGFFAAALWVLSFLGAPLPQKLSLLLSMANVWLFFGPMAYRSVRAWVRREQWKRRNRR